MPVEYVRSGASMNCSSSANSRMCGRRACISLRERRKMAPFRKTFSRPVSSMSKPAPSSISGATVPRTSTLPSVGRSTRAITLRSVDLPAPFRPMMPIDSPRRTDRLTCESAFSSSVSMPPRSHRMRYSLNVRTRSCGTRYWTETSRRSMIGRSRVAGLDVVGNAVSVSLEDEPADHQCADPRHGRGDEHIRRRDLALEDGRPERFHQVRHRIEHQEAAVVLRQERERVKDGREIDPAREDDLVDRDDVGEHHGDGRQREGDAQREQCREQNGYRKERQGRAEVMSEGEHDDRQRHKRDEQVDDAGEHCGEDEDGLGDVYLLDDRRVTPEACGRPRRRLREEVPQHQRRQDVDGEVLDRHAQDVGEHEGEDAHEEERMEHRPQDAQRRALVADLQVARDQLAQEAAVRHQFAQVSQHRALPSKWPESGQTTWREARGAVPSLRRALICTSKSAGGAAGRGAGQVTMRDENGAVSAERGATDAGRTNGNGGAAERARKLDGYFQTREKLLTRRAVLWLGQTCNI